MSVSTSPGACSVSRRRETSTCCPSPALTDEELQALGVQRSEELCFYVLCAVKEPVGESTLNLRCPVAVNDQSQEAMQVILETDVYHMHHKLGELSLGGEAPLC